MEGKLFFTFYIYIYTLYKNIKQNTQIPEVLNSVVQGSVLDPILYVIYVNDFSILLAADSLLYAIDITPPRAITMSLATPPCCHLHPLIVLPTHTIPRGSTNIRPGHCQQAQC